MSDLHHGHKLGFLSPGVELEEEVDGRQVKHTLVQNPAQKYLWAVMESALKVFNPIIGDNDVSLLMMGDITQGTKRAKELQSTRTADHILIASATMDYLGLLLGERLKHVRFAKGTGSHVFEEGSSEILVNELFKAKFPKVDTSVVYHGLLDLHGVKIDYAHHGPATGRRVWLRGNEARFYLRDRMITDAVEGKQPANLYLRGHHHSWVEEVLTVGKYRSTLCVLPSMCFLDDYARQATGSTQYVSNGIVLFELEDGRLTRTIPFINTMDIRTREVLK